MDSSSSQKSNNVPKKLIYQFWYLLYRAAIQTYGNISWLSIELLTHYIIAVILSAVLSFTETVGKAPAELCLTQAVILIPICKKLQSSLLGSLSFVATGSLFIILSSAQGTFGNERAVFWREKRTGTSTNMYFLAKIVSDLPKIALCCVMFVIGLSTLYTFLLKYMKFNKKSFLTNIAFGLFTILFFAFIYMDGLWDIQ